MIKTILNFFFRHKVYVALFAIIVTGLFLRFYMIDKHHPFGFDQARDSWKVRDIIHGQIVLEGPRTGIGHFHLGPLYFYLLVPFFYFSNMDPTALHYFNLLANLFNFIAIFVVIKNIFSQNYALFTITVYAASSYFITQNQTPWNVSLLIGLSFLAFYSVFKILSGSHRFIIYYSLLIGILFNIHFSAVIFLAIIPLIFLLVKDKIKVTKYFLFSIPIILIFFIPTVLFNLTRHNTDYFKFKEFLNYNLIGFHFRFMLYRLGDILIQFEPFLFKQVYTIKYLIPIVYLSVVYFFDKDKKFKVLELTNSIFLVCTLFIFTIYGGPVSDYYFLLTLPTALTIIIYLQNKLISKYKISILFLAIYWVFFIFLNTKSHWVKVDSKDGIFYLKEEVKNRMKQGEKFEYNEGEIRSYIYEVLEFDKKSF